MDFKQLLKNWLFVAAGVVIASNTASGIHYDSSEALVVAVLLLSACNVFLKPVLMLFSLPFIILTFGIGIWVINALLFLFVGGLVSGFHIDSFGSALWGALVVSLTSALASLFFGAPGARSVNIKVDRHMATPGGRSEARRRSETGRKPKSIVEDDDDVIDI
jgi:putative membrane protein